MEELQIDSPITNEIRATSSVVPNTIETVQIVQQPEVLIEVQTRENLNETHHQVVNALETTQQYRSEIIPTSELPKEQEPKTNMMFGAKLEDLKKESTSSNILENSTKQETKTYFCNF